MQKLFKRGFLVACLALFMVLFSNNVAIAQETGLKLSPARFEELVEPGDVLQKKIKITNQSDAPKTLYAYLRDFKAEGEGGSVKLYIPGTEEGSFLASWINIDVNGVEFKPREEKEVSFTIVVPDSAGPGGYYGAILFGPDAPKLDINSEDKGAGMSIVHQVASLILLQVNGDVNETAQVREFNTNKDFYNTPFDVDFTVRIENNGNVHVKPQGSISVENMFGKEVANVIVNDGGSNVLPGLIRVLNEKWSDDMGFGRYKATLGLTYGTSAKIGGEGKKTLFGEKYFWIIPWGIVGPVLTVFGILVVLLIIFVKFYKNKAIKKAMDRAGIRHVGAKTNNHSSGAQFSLAMFLVFMVLFFILVGMYFMFFA